MRDRNSPLTVAAIPSLDWEKMDGLLPALVQDPLSGHVLMLGYMDRDALAATLSEGLVTFWSRSRETLWTKGETSGNVLKVSSVHSDCDHDALLILAEPQGPTCHLGPASCFGSETGGGAGWLAILSRIVQSRARSGEAQSYTRRLLDEGISRIAQKIGEEGVEVALAAVTSSPDRCAEEVADLLYHLAILMEARGFGWAEVLDILQRRHEADGKRD